MDINAEKVELVKRVLEIEDADTLQTIKAAISGIDHDWWNDLDSAAKQSIERALQQSDKGELYNSNDVFDSIS
jgi:hypothetical protein